MGISPRVTTAVLTFVLVASTACGEDIQGAFTIPYISGHPDTQAFSGHPGWVDVFYPGEERSVSARVGPDAAFTLPEPSAPGVLVAMFDKIETPPVIVSRWPARDGEYDVPIPVEYACVPPGHPETWDREYMVRDHDFWQTIRLNCTQLYGITFFDGPKFVWWGNKVNVSVYEDGAHGHNRYSWDHWEGPVDHVTTCHSDHGFPRMGWRHGGMPVVPGRKYGIRVGSYKHGGEHFQLDAFVRPDNGDGYAEGTAYRHDHVDVARFSLVLEPAPGDVYLHRTPLCGDLCMLVFGNSHGQLVENQIRSEEWDIRIAPRDPTRNWGQSFLSHGVSLAGVSFWATKGRSPDTSCVVRIHEGGPDGPIIGPARTAVAHDSPERLIIRYPEVPNMDNDRRFDPCDLYQVAYSPDELPLQNGGNYYVELEFSEPVRPYADSNYYMRGFAYREGQKIEKIEGQDHYGPPRLTLTVNVVTYENAGGAPNTPSPPWPEPGPDGNLIANSGAETGDFAFWEIGGDPAIDPPTRRPDPQNHTGLHRFGAVIGCGTGDTYQYQEVPGIEPGARYVAGMWGANPQETPKSVELLWCDGPFGSEERCLARTEGEPSYRWRKYEGAPLSPTGDKITIILRYRTPGPDDLTCIHVDDVYLRKVD